MENIVLVIHLILAICLIAVVLLQRSEGGGMGLGGGGGAGTRVWRDAGGNLFQEEYGRYVLYRFPESDYVFQI